MIEILKEMGRAKENQILARKICDFHRESLIKHKNNSFLSEYHKKEYVFWKEKLFLVNKHLEQQHRLLKYY